MPSEIHTSALHEAIADRLAAKGWNVEHLAKLSGLPASVIAALVSGDQKRTPSAPYLRGYLERIAPLLELDAPALWSLYHAHDFIRSAGARDALPKNRYALGYGARRWWLAAVCAAALLFVYFGWRGLGLLRQPALTITNPGDEITAVSSPTIILEGFSNPRDRVTIDGEEAFVAPDGRFQKEYALDPGMNVIEIATRRFLGKETRIMRQVIYQP